MYTTLVETPSYSMDSDFTEGPDVRSLDVDRPADVPGRDDLDQSEITDDQMSVDVALDLKLPVIDIKGKAQRRVLVRDVRQFAVRQVGDETIEYGFSIRMVITAAADTLDANLTIPMVTASAQLGRLSAAAKMQVVGYRDKAILQLFPQFATLDVDNYGEYTRAIDRIRAHISKKPEKIWPVELRKYGASQADPLLDGVVSAYAIRSLYARKSISQVMQGQPKEQLGIVRKIYAELAGISSDDERPENTLDAVGPYLRWL